MNQHNINGQQNIQDSSSQQSTNQHAQNRNYQQIYPYQQFPLPYLQTVVYLPYQFVYPSYVNNPQYTENIINQNNMVPNFPHTQTNQSYQDQSQTNQNQFKNQNIYQIKESLCKNEEDNPHQQQLQEQEQFQAKNKEEENLIPKSCLNDQLDQKSQSQEQQDIHLQKDKISRKTKKIIKKKQDFNVKMESQHFLQENRDENQIKSSSRQLKQQILDDQLKNKKEIIKNQFTRCSLINEIKNNDNLQTKNEYEYQLTQIDQDQQQDEILKVNKVSLPIDKDTMNENKKFNNQSNILLKELEEQFQNEGDALPSETLNSQNPRQISTDILSSQNNTIKNKKIKKTEQKQKNKDDQQQQIAEINEAKKKLILSLNQNQLDLLQNAVSINRQNANKNIIKSFQKHINTTQQFTYEYSKQQQQLYYFKVCQNEEININENPTEEEQQKFLKKFNKFMKNKTNTNLHIKQIIQNRIYGQILFSDFLQSYSMTWLEQANVLNKEQYKIIIDFYKWCCEKQELLIFLNNFNTIQSISSQDGKNKFHELNYLFPDIQQIEEKEDEVENEENIQCNDKENLKSEEEQQ